MTELKRLTGSDRIPADHIRFCNGRIVSLMSLYLNFMETAITPEALEDVANSCSLSRERAFGECLAALCEVGTDRAEREFTANYIIPMVRELDPAVFENDPYYQTVRIAEGKAGKWELKTMELAPCQAFVCNDFRVFPDGRMLPQIGFFPRAYRYPAVLENGREWMTLMPNETVTTLPAVEKAHGKVLTYGLGLGYFPFMASSKDNVDSVTIVERSPEVIELFKTLLLPQFPHKDKIRVICSDAFAYWEQEMPQEGYDFVFADIWHDVGDDRELYLRMKALEHLSPDTEYSYWLEDTIRCYLAAELWPPRL
jgi:hypothetical protein